MCMNISVSHYMQLNDLRIIVCLRKFEVSVERILAFNIIENWQNIHTLLSMLLYY